MLAKNLFPSESPELLRRSRHHHCFETCGAQAALPNTPSTPQACHGLDDRALQVFLCQKWINHPVYEELSLQTPRKAHGRAPLWDPEFYLSTFRRMMQ